MTARFNKFLPIILQHEGGSKFTNDPTDEGGATKYGISLRFLRTLKGHGDIDGDGDVDQDDIKALQPDDVAQFYADQFYTKCGAEAIPGERLALQVFDHAVNAGVGSAIKLLQRVAHVDDDGILGTKTFNAVFALQYDIAADNYRLQRHAFYCDLVNKKQSRNKYLKGWCNRANDCATVKISG